MEKPLQYEPLIQSYYSKESVFQLYSNIGLDKNEQNIAFSLDLIEHYFYLYLIGLLPTLHRILKEVREFINKESNALSRLYDLLSVIERRVLEEEFYELMPKLLKAKKKIRKLCNRGL